MKKYNQGLDFIRIFAMLAVIWVHLTVYLPIPNEMRVFFTWGAHGVDFFFVLSGFLSCHSFEQKVSPLIYYKKRAVRILPSYYVAVILAMGFRELVLRMPETDIFHLRWIRYFLALNTVLPSNHYDIWNNIYGLWTMSAFVWFYAMAPLIFKWVRSFWNAFVLFIGSFALAFAWKKMILIVFSKVAGLDSINVLTGASPFGKLHLFVIGIMVYFALKEQKIWAQIAIPLAVIIMGVLTKRYELIWAAACGMLILLFSHVSVELHGIAGVWIQKLGKESFHVYLAHLFVFHCMDSIVKQIGLQGAVSYGVWATGSLIGIIVVCIIMDAAEKGVLKMSGRKG